MKALWSVVLLSLLAPCAIHAGESPVSRALRKGKLHLDLRYRLEQVDQDGFTENAEASTARLRLGYETGRLHGFRAFAELDAIKVIGDDGYDSTANGRTVFPVVPDPEDEEVNQLYLGYDGFESLDLVLGRQRIVLDNQRFIGPVGWRQNEQTYDAFTAWFRPAGKLQAFYGRLNNANRVFGEHHPDPSRADLALSTDLLNVSWGFSAGKLTGYAYLLEFDDVVTASHRNLGLRFAGRHGVCGDWALTYAAEIADQADYADGAATVDAEYYRAEIGAAADALHVRVGYELLGGDGTYGFATPLATLHAFNGWADQFLATPPDGLEDVFVRIGGTLGAYTLAGIYHDFAADSGGADYGTEINLDVSRKLGERGSVALTYADYDADTFSVDTKKLWLTLRFAL